MRPVLCLLLIAAAVRSLWGQVPEDVSAPSQEGRARFLVEQAPLALAWYGPASFIMLQPCTPAAGVAVYAGGSALGWLGPVLLTHRLPMTRAQAHLAVAYGYRGILAGHSLDALLKWGPEHRGEVVSGSWPRRFLGLSAAAFCGQGLGYLLADGLDLCAATLATA